MSCSDTLWRKRNAHESSVDSDLGHEEVVKKYFVFKLHICITCQSGKTPIEFRVDDLPTNCFWIALVYISKLYSNSTYL